MRKQKVYRICLLISVIGIGLIYASTQYIQPPEVAIGEIDKSWNGKQVRISGEVTSSYVSSGHSFLTVSDKTGEIKAVKFDSRKPYSEGEKVNVTGSVSLYEGGLEIIAEEVRPADGKTR